MPSFVLDTRGRQSTSPANAAPGCGWVWVGGVGHGVWREVSTQAEWWHMIVTSAFERLVQEDHEFEARRAYGAVVDDDDMMMMMISGITEFSQL